MKTLQRWMALAALCTCACSVTRSVRPVGEGKTEVGLSVGGPIFTNLGPPIPAPLTAIYGRHGLNEKTDVDVGLHVPVAGAIGLDAGAARLLRAQDGGIPAVMAGGRLLLFANALWLTGRDNPNGGGYASDIRLFEEAYAHASWAVGEKVLLWAGADLFMQLEDGIVRPTLLAGGEWRPVKRFGIALEARQMAFTTDQRFAAVDFVGPADLGAFAVQLGFRFHLQGEP